MIELCEWWRDESGSESGEMTESVDFGAVKMRRKWTVFIPKTECDDRIQPRRSKSIAMAVGPYAGTSKSEVWFVCGPFAFAVRRPMR